MNGRFFLPGLLALLAIAGPSAPPTALKALQVPLEGIVSSEPPEAGPAAVVIDEVPEKREPPPPAPPRPVVVDNSLRVGSSGPEVRAMEEQLEALHYLVGKVDGVFDNATRHGVIAFQKINGLPRNGKGDERTLSRLSGASPPTPAFTSPADHLEVDIARQVILVVRGGQVSAVLPTSTGNNKLFTSEGWTRRATTPNGRFRITRKIPDWRISPLGVLYKPSYFNGGIAFHGNPSVPVVAASHGCVRLPMQFADWFFANASPVGTAVYVHGGPAGANPQPFIDDAPASQPASGESPPSNPSPTPSESPASSATPEPTAAPSDSPSLPAPPEPSPTSSPGS